ncbi:hypothetical protein ACP4OV_015382 [Aristida adscensionis]
MGTGTNSRRCVKRLCRLLLLGVWLQLQWRIAYGGSVELGRRSFPNGFVFGTASSAYQGQ